MHWPCLCSLYMLRLRYRLEAAVAVYVTALLEYGYDWFLLCASLLRLCDTLYEALTGFPTSDQARIPAELKHISKRRKRN